MIPLIVGPAALYLSYLLFGNVHALSQAHCDKVLEVWIAIIVLASEEISNIFDSFIIRIQLT